MKALLVGLAVFVAAILILPRLGQDRQPLLIDVPASTPAMEATGVWPSAATRPEIDPQPYRVCGPVYRPLRPGDGVRIPEVHV